MRSASTRRSGLQATTIRFSEDLCAQANRRAGELADQVDRAGELADQVDRAGELGDQVDESE